MRKGFMMQISPRSLSFPISLQAFSLLLASVFLGTTFLGPSAAQAAKGPWEMVKDEAGVQVYHRSVDGSDYVEFKGEATIKASVPALVALLRDVSACKKWQHKCGNKTSLSPAYSCKITDLPWPLSDRYALQHTLFVFAPDRKSVTIRIRNIPISKLPPKLKAKLPPLKDIIHMKKADGFWKLIKVDEGTTKVIYQMHLDPAGTIPSAIANAGFVDKPFDSLNGMKEIVQKPKYKNHK